MDYPRTLYRIGSYLQNIHYRNIATSALGTYNEIVWIDGGTQKPTEQECIDQWAVIVAEDAAQADSDAAKLANQEDVNARFLLSQLANKTPQEIYTAMQNAMDGWTTLADARADLREWLPLMAAIIAWKV